MYPPGARGSLGTSLSKRAMRTPRLSGSRQIGERHPRFVTIEKERGEVHIRERHAFSSYNQEHPGAALAEDGRNQESFDDCVMWLGFSGAVADDNLGACGSRSTHADFRPIRLTVGDLRGNLPYDQSGCSESGATECVSTTSYSR